MSPIFSLNIQKVTLKLVVFNLPDSLQIKTFSLQVF